MAIDTAQKRCAAVNPGSPWRGVMVVASDPGMSAGARAAAMFLYAMGAGTPTPGARYGSVSIRPKHYGQVEIRPSRFGSIRLAPGS